MGYTGCRLCKPSGLRKETLPVILEEDEENEDNRDPYRYKVNKTVAPSYKYDEERPQSQKQFPISSSDPRTIVWEMKRPPLEPLPSSKDDTKREEILRNLYRQMMPSIDDEGVLYDPPKDENCLFNALRVGLGRARPVMADGMTTKSLREELMRFLIWITEAENSMNVKKRKSTNATKKSPPTTQLRLNGKDYSLEGLAKSQFYNRKKIVAPSAAKFNIRDYTNEMYDYTPFTCKRGGRLECYLFAKKYEVNVAIHQTDDKYNRKGRYTNKKKDLKHGVFVSDNAPTIHLMHHDEHFTLLRYNWPWEQFELNTRKKRHTGTSYNTFDEHRKTWLASQVDSYNFVRDNNNLFHNLMQGLVITGARKPSNPIRSSELSLRGMKRDLLKHLKDNLHREFKPVDKDEAKHITTLEAKVSHRLSIDKKQPTENQSPVDHYAQLIQDEELGDDELEMHLFAKSKNVNVILYDQVRDTFEWRHEFEATTKDSAETIHLLRHMVCKPNDANGSSQDGSGVDNNNTNTGGNCKVYYTLFMPKLYSIMKALMMVDDTNQLQKIYDKISAAIQDRNGLVVDYNPLLTALLGCNTNMLFLGSKEQSRGALFYIGPYINKNGVEIIDALPLIVKAQDDAVTYLSVAEDSGTEKRTVQHTLHKTLNKLNSQMEVSDTQAAGALFDLDARITSEIFSYYNANGYKNFILDTRDGLHQASGPVGMVDDLGENDTDEDSQNAESGDEGDDMSVDGSGEENYDTDDDESDNDSCSDEEDNEEGENTPEQTNEEDGKEGDIWREWENDCCEKFNLSHKKGDYGTAKIFSMGQDEETGKERFQKRPAKNVSTPYHIRNSTVTVE